jgi:hypothetical protein
MYHALFERRPVISRSRGKCQKTAIPRKRIVAKGRSIETAVIRIEIVNAEMPNKIKSINRRTFFFEERRTEKRKTTSSADMTPLNRRSHFSIYWTVTHESIAGFSTLMKVGVREGLYSLFSIKMTTPSWPPPL